MKRRLYTLFISLLLSFPVILSGYANTSNDSTKITTGNDIVQRAMKYIGVPYRSGRMNPKVGFDCSGFTSYVFKKENIQLTHSSRSQFTQGTQICDCKELHKGDLVFFSGSRNSSQIGHVGIVTEVNHLRRVHSHSFMPAVPAFVFLPLRKLIIKSAM